RTMWLFTLARWGCLPFALIGNWVCWRWAREAYGPPAGVLAAALWTFCPSVLGNGSLLSPDIGGAATGAFAGYAFWRWLSVGSQPRSVIAGVGLGIALLARTTWIVLVPLWTFGWILCRYLADRGTSQRCAPSLCGLVCIFGLAAYILNLGYLFEGSFVPLGEYEFVSKSLSGNPNGAPGNRFRHHWAGTLPLPLPSDYVHGDD